MSAPGDTTLHGFTEDRGNAANTARAYGALTRRNRFGVLGAWVGFDYVNAAGYVVLESMAAFPYREPGQ